MSPTLVESFPFPAPHQLLLKDPTIAQPRVSLSFAPPANHRLLSREERCVAQLAHLASQHHSSEYSRMKFGPKGMSDIHTITCTAGCPSKMPLDSLGEDVVMGAAIQYYSGVLYFFHLTEHSLFRRLSDDLCTTIHSDAKLHQGNASPAGFMYITESMVAVP